MRRRTFVGGLAGGVALTAFPQVLTAAPVARIPWERLRRRLGSRLIPVNSPLVVCRHDTGCDPRTLFSKLKNPYYLGDEPALTQTLGWVDAWTSQPSQMAVAAESSSDVVAAINFARQHSIRPVIKGGGHSYFGNSNAAGSLLIWTRRMDRIQLHQSFVPAGAPANASGREAVTIGAGALWGRAYDAVSTKAGRYVQGGGCLTVGVAGLIQGGGFGSFSKAYGTGAANLIEARVVTADARVLTVNHFQNPDLFFALRGGGGGTFGVVTDLTLATHPLPAHIGAAIFSVQATSDAAWKRLVDRMLAFYARDLFGPTWGEQIGFAPGRRLSVSMLAKGLDQEQVQAAWRPFLGWLRERGSDYAVELEPGLLAIPGRKFWDPDFLRSIPGVVMKDDRPESPAGNIFWAANLGEAGQVLHAYQSAWIPAHFLNDADRPQLAEALIAAAREWSVTLHTNKGLAGGAREAIAATAETATNPEVLTAFALLICAADAQPAWPGIRGHEPDVAKARRDTGAVRRAMQPIRAIVPKAGAYVSEADYFQEAWQEAYWGSNYRRLAAIKRTYDPTNLFRGHHTVW